MYFTALMRAETSVWYRFKHQILWVMSFDGDGECGGGLEIFLGIIVML